jgi:hypothetical protein
VPGPIRQDLRKLLGDRGDIICVRAVRGTSHTPFIACRQADARSIGTLPSCFPRPLAA